MGLWIEESERADQSSSAQQKTFLESPGGHARQRQRGQPSLAEVTKRDDSKPDASSFCGPCPHKEIVMDSCSPSHVDFLTNWSVASTKFLADDDVVLEATESDAAVSRSDAFNPSPLSFFRSLAPSLSGTLALALSLFRFFSSPFRPFFLSLSPFCWVAHGLGTVTLLHIPFRWAVHGEGSEASVGVDWLRLVGWCLVSGFVHPRILRSCRVIVANMLQWLQQFTGVSAILSCGPSIFQSANVPLSALECAIVTNLCTLGATVFVMLAMDKWVRRTLLLIGALSMAVCLALTAVAAHLAVASHKALLGWLVLMLVCLCMSAFAISW